MPEVPGRASTRISALSQLRGRAGERRGRPSVGDTGPVQSPPSAGTPLLLPAVVPPPPGAGAGVNPAYQLTPSQPDAPSAVPPLRQAPGPAHFGAPGSAPEADNGSPASLLGPSAHAASPDTHTGRLAAPQSPIPTPQSPPHPAATPQAAGVPTAHELMFGPTPPAAQPSAITSPAAQPPTAQPPAPIPGPRQNLESAGMPMLAGDPKRKTLLAKLRRRSTLVPLVAAVVVIAVFASLVAIAGSSANSGLSNLGHHAGNPGKSAAALARRINTVTVALRSPSDDPRPDISVKIGNDPHPLHVVLDTGSVGLRVFSNLVPTGDGKGIDVTAQQDSVEYVDGTQFTGPVAKALVHVGTLTTTRTVAFQLVRKVTCDPQIPYCPASGGAAHFEADDVDGVMGIGLGGAYQGDPITNPLLALAAPYRNSWSIAMSGGAASLPAPGALVLGARGSGLSAGAVLATAAGCTGGRVAKLERPVQLVLGRGRVDQLRPDGVRLRQRPDCSDRQRIPERSDR